MGGYPRKPGADPSPDRRRAFLLRFWRTAVTSDVRCLVNLADVAEEICDGDLLLFRGRGLVARFSAWPAAATTRTRRGPCGGETTCSVARCAN
jgi:hypothetical protein